MVTIEKVAENLFDKIRSRFSAIDTRDENRKKTQDPSQARFFSFNFSAPTENEERKNFGIITISLVDGQSLKIFYDMEIDKNMDEVSKDYWYKFIRGLRKFSKRNMLDSFDVRDISKSGLDPKDFKHLNKDADVYDADEALNESKLSGTSRSSYQVLETAKIIVRHSKRISEDDSPVARSRHINAIFIENQDGERFKMPSGTTVNEARVIARHVRNEGTIHDEFGQHLMEMLGNMHSLKVFSRNMRGRTFEDRDTQVMIEAAQDYFGETKSNFFSMRTQKGYEQYRESWSPSDSEILTDEIDLDEMRSRFEKRIFDERLESALPLIARAHSQKQSRVEEEFGAWMESVIKDTYKRMIHEDVDVQAPVDSNSPLSVVGADRMGIDSMSQTKSDMDDGEGNRDMMQFFRKHDINVQSREGKYVFTSQDERSRALDWAAKEGIELDEENTEVEQYDPQPFGASMNDQTFRNDVAMESLKRLAGI
jgi:hypothetical protein